MSHFTVIVIGNDVEEQLEPYAEQEFEEKYGVFKDTEEESLQEYLNGDVEIVTLSNGEKYSKYNQMFRDFNAKTFKKDTLYPEGSTLSTGKFTELYPTFEEFMSGWHGTSERDSKTGKYGYWHNPQAKWDWYQVGGRWSGFFKLKQGFEQFAEAKIGLPGAFGNKPKNGWVDSIQLQYIDIEGMQNDAIKEAHETYDKIESILKGRTFPSWIETVNKYKDNIDLAREEYNSNLIVKDFNEANFHIWGDFYEDFGHSRQEYVEKCQNSVMVPYAVVKDGKWFQKGEMGWWGMSNDEMSQDEWNKKFWDMIKSLDPKTQLTLVDCHI